MAKFTVFQITALVILLSFYCDSVKAKPAPRDPNGPTYNPLGELILHPGLEHRPEDSAGSGHIELQIGVIYNDISFDLLTENPTEPTDTENEPAEPTDTEDELAESAEATFETPESTDTTDEPTEATDETTQPSSNTSDEPTQPAETTENPSEPNDKPTEPNDTNDDTKLNEPTENPEKTFILHSTKTFDIEDSREDSEESEKPPQEPESKSSRSPAASQTDDNSLPTTKKPTKKQEMSTEDILNSKCSDGPGRNGKIICQSVA